MEREVEARRRDAWIADLRERGGPDVQQLAELYEAALAKAEQELATSRERAVQREKELLHMKRVAEQERDAARAGKRQHKQDNAKLVDENLRLRQRLTAAEARVRELREALEGWRDWAKTVGAEEGHPIFALYDATVDALQATQEDS